MIAAIQPDPKKPPHVIYATYRKGLSLRVRTYCNLEIDAMGGVLQLPDSVKQCPACVEGVASVTKALAGG